MDLNGLVVPPTTPFGENNKIDEKALASHLYFLAKHGVTRILVNGTTAEFFSLIPEERKNLLTFVRRHFNGIILFNTGSDSLLQSIEAARWAEEGADAIVAMTPYYYTDAAEKGLVDYFNRLAESTTLPMILYNFTKHTGNPISPEILREVEHIAIKDSSGDFSLIGETPCYLAGTSSRIAEAYKAGAKGFVSSAANFMPQIYVKIEELLKRDDIAGAEKMQLEANTIRQRMVFSNEIAGIKRELSKLIENYPERVRLPLTR